MRREDLQRNHTTVLREVLQVSTVLEVTSGSDTDQG